MREADQQNKDRDAAPPLRTDELDSMDRDEDCRPEHSAYASEICAVYFQGKGPLHIPRELLHQNAELSRRDVAIGSCSSSFRRLHLNDIAYDTGHVLIHFLTTGSYQCLKPQGDTTAKRDTSEFAIALRTYVAAESLQLSSLHNLARSEIIRLGNKLSLLSLIDIMDESWLSLSTSPGIVAFVESYILAFMESVTYLIAERVLSEIGTPKTLSKVLLKTMLLLKTSEMPQGDESLPNEELVEIPRGLADNKSGATISRSKISDVDRAMKEAEKQAEEQAEEQAAREVEERVAKDAREAAIVAVAQRAAAEAAEAEAAREEEEIFEEAETTPISIVPAAEKIASAEQSFVFPTPEGE
ncbi:hypothetical protein B0J13DRAFT_581797 [Dactylonectria estremocensis]|uniref:BTB domain-containing protein n=1 Tax=Dactylonectria estremocensis TaxID=1079267 RepID=A0A9P9J9W6_9HYPO|nr:hypothetical protein B0J13DRAFT_581797 [Dactylonectria estremocensis]